MTNLRKLLFCTILVVYASGHRLAAQQPFKFRPTIDIPVEQSGTNLDLAWAGGMNSAQFGTIELNGDGLADLMVFDRTTNKISTFISTGSDYQYDPQYEYLFPENLNSWLLLADYDCDGRKDLFTNTTFGLRVYRNTTVDQLSFELVADPLLSESGGQMVNLQVGSSDLPAITDVDGDGDLDILTFRFATGSSVEYHQNQSMENSGNCQQLEFKLVTNRWGDFEECECEDYAFGTTCSNPGGRTLHAGGKALLVFDQDFDGAMELVFADEFCTNIAFLYNNGDAENALFTNAEVNFPNAGNPINYFIYPGLFLEDVNFDGRKDLLSSPGVFENFGLGVNFKRSSYLYLNDGVTGVEAFNIFQTDGFLQERMIELGENATPLFVDIDGDGDEDMIVGNRGNREGSTFYATFIHFDNTGSVESPQFTLASEDYLGLSSSQFNTLKPSFGDLDGDGRKDLIFSAANGSGQTNVYYLLNNTNQGFDPVSTTPEIMSFNIQAGDHPHFVDLDADGKADLLLGKRTGRLEYWENTSSGGNFSFELVSEEVAGIIDDSFRRELVPLASDLNGDSELELITTDATGVMRIYQEFLEASETNPAQIHDLLIEPVEGENSVRSRWGRGATLAIANLGNILPHLAVGSKMGGLFLLENLSLPGNGNGGSEFAMELFPNPGVEMVTLRGNQSFTYQIYNSLGQLIFGDPLAPGTQLVRFDSRILAPGIYFVSGISESGASDVKRLIVP